MEHPLLISLLSPMVLAFVLGIIATLVKSDLKFPEELYTALTIYLLVAIGLKGGYKLSLSTFAEFWKPGMAAVLIGVSIPVWSYFILRYLGKFDVANAAALAAHYGSVSAVTFSEALAFHDNLKLTYEGYMPSLLTILEVPAILIAIFIARTSTQDKASQAGGASTKEVMRELLAGKSTLLLVGCLVIGLLAGKRGWDQVSPLFDVPFRGVLTLFLLEAGLVTGRRLGDLSKAGPFLFGFGIVMPVLHACIGIVLGKAAGLSMGGATILGVLAASASYIAAPAAVRVALPTASPTYYLTASLAITFPFNILIGLPLYHAIAQAIYAI
ncbi:MAG: sodium-dependent bicarbonate transport family permease [Rhizobacter sp.]|nr:sodium-dependent bicarbonate transport family permease [Chlorobiales bacterium]